MDVSVWGLVYVTLVPMEAEGIISALELELHALLTEGAGNSLKAHLGFLISS